MLQGNLKRAVMFWNPEAVFGADEKSFFLDSETMPSEHVDQFLVSLEAGAVKRWLIVADAYAEWEQQQQDPEADHDEEPPSLDGECVVHITPNAMAAYVMVLPPVGGGMPMAPLRAARELKKLGVTDGLIAGACESAALENFKVFTAAIGTPPTPGIDGDIEDLFARETPKPHQKESKAQDGDPINYRERHWLITVHSGQVICKLTQPVPGIAGMTVTGRSIAPQEGKMPVIPRGANTEVNQQGTELVASCDGRLVYHAGKFSVETHLIINDNVGYNIGNIAMPGDVTIRGSVEAGFIIYAKGNLTVEGVVENAYLSSKGDIRLKMGIKGDGAAVVEAVGDIDCKFAENATLRSQGSISAEYMVNCDISARNAIHITRGKGALIGGTVHVGRLLEARTIGNTINRSITISMGMNPEMMQEIQNNRQRVETLRNKVLEHGKNIAFLERRSNLEPEYVRLLQQLKLDRSIQSMKISKLQNSIQQAEALFDPNACEISFETIYPPASIQIGVSSYQVQHEWMMSKILLRDGDIIVVPR